MNKSHPNPFQEVTPQLASVKSRSDLQVTKVLSFKNFFPAEDYHQDFYQKNSQYYQKYKKDSGRHNYIEAMKEKYNQK